MLFSGAVCVNAEDLVFGGTLTIDYNDNSRVYELAEGEVLQNYRSQIQLVGGNTGYTFAFVQGTYLPPGLSITEDGVVSGYMTMRGSYSAISLLITAPDGTSKTFSCSLRIKPRPVYIYITAPSDAVYDGVTHYKAEGKYVDYHTGEELEDKPVLRYGLDGLTDVVDAGEYRITYGTSFIYDVKPNAENSYISGDRYITVHRASANELTINGVHDAEFDYDGQSHGLTGVSITSSLEPAKTIPYGIRYYNRRTGALIEGEPIAAGEYTAEVYSTDTNYEPKSETAVITINAEKVSFTITGNSFTYNGEGQAPTVTAEKTGEPFSEYTVNYLNASGQPVAAEDLKDGKPYKAGTYRVNITLNEPDKYLTDPITNNTFTISKQEITLKIPQKTYYKADEDNHPLPQTPVVVPDPADFTGYTAQYQRLAEDGTTPVGDPSPQVTEIGTYRVIFSLTDPDNYTFGTGNAQYVEVADKTINFEFTNLTKTYIRDTAQYATVKATTEGELFTNHYSVVYSQNNVQVDAPTNAGSYYITIQPEHGHGVGTKNPEFPYLVINPQTVTFSVAEDETTSVDFDDQDHKVNVVFNAESDIIAEDYAVKFRNKATNVITDAAHDAGEYDIVIDVVNENYTAASEVIGTFTINSTYVWNIGNSPAAMIYKDTKMTDTQKDELLNQFKASRVFAEGNVPEGCKAGISYPLINGIDLDGDTNTVIVKDINNYTDPGITINNVEVKNGTPVAVEGVEGLYTVTYNGDNSLRRYVIEVGGKIGDTDADGIVNALDANALDKLNRVPANVTEARIWDVNKDGVLDRNDAAAIRKRFGVKLVPYYSWVK